MNPLKMIGLWEGEYEDPAWLHPRLLVRESRYPDQSALALYLRSGVRLNEDLGYSYCRFTEGPPDFEMGNADRSDGIWIWPEGLWIYVERYNVQLPEEFCNHARHRLFRIPDNLDPVELESKGFDVTFWKEWCESWRRRST